MMIKEPSATNISIFLPQMTSIISVWIPSPAQAHKSPDSESKPLVGYDAV